jgi:hypothetical protein
MAWLEVKAVLRLSRIDKASMGWQLVPQEDGEVVAKHPLGFTGGYPLLIEALPLFAKAGDDAGEGTQRLGLAGAAR